MKLGKTYTFAPEDEKIVVFNDNENGDAAVDSVYISAEAAFTVNGYIDEEANAPAKLIDVSTLGLSASGVANKIYAVSTEGFSKIVINCDGNVVVKTIV